MTLSSQLRTFLSLASEPSTGPAADELVRLAEEYREEERKRGMRQCLICLAAEWPCFLVNGVCRMCQARKRSAA